jgi:hypothetical protein
MYNEPSDFAAVQLAFCQIAPSSKLGIFRQNFVTKILNKACGCIQRKQRQQGEKFKTDSAFEAFYIHRENIFTKESWLLILP